MDKIIDLKVDYPCKICNKFYSSYKSLWNHNKKFHTTNNNFLTTNNNFSTTNNNFLTTDMFISFLFILFFL